MRKYSARTAIVILTLAIGVIAGHLATRAHTDTVRTQTCGGVTSQWDTYGCGYADGVAAEERARSHGPLAAATTEDGDLTDPHTGAPLDYRPTPIPGYYSPDCRAPGDCGYADNGTDH